MIKRVLFLDMDGTIVDFYGVQDWQKCLDIDKNEKPYVIAQPMYNMTELNFILNVLRSQGWKVVILSWLSRNNDEDFHERIRKAKTDWLARYDVPYDGIIMTPYGTDKWQTACSKYPHAFKVLADDSEEIRNSWHGYAIDGGRNLTQQLAKLMLNYNYDTER